MLLEKRRLWSSFQCLKRTNCVEQLFIMMVSHGPNLKIGSSFKYDQLQFASETSLQHALAYNKNDLIKVYLYFIKHEGLMDDTVLCPLLFWGEHQIFTFSFECQKWSYYSFEGQLAVCSLSVSYFKIILSPIADWCINNLAIPGMISKFIFEEISQTLKFALGRCTLLHAKCTCRQTSDNQIIIDIEP